MTSGADILDAVVVGAGWAGLGVSHALAKRGLRHRVLERGRIGETWRTQRWDNFRINTPKSQTVMPGDIYTGTDPDGAMTSGEFVALLEDYAARHGLPVETDAPVTELLACDGLFRLTLPGGSMWARNVVIASSSQNCLARPAVSALLPPEVRQIDSSAYRNAASLERGAVLVVGSGQSGGQIAEDLVQAGRSVFLATSRVGRLPRMYRGTHTSVWMVLTGLMDVTRKELLQQGPIPGRALTGALHTISLQSLSAQGVVLLGRLTGVDDGRLSFSDEAEDHVRHGDESSAKIRSQIDAYIASKGIDAPEAEPDPAEAIEALLPKPPLRSLDLAAQGIATVIWCTGFKGDFGWVRVPDVLDAQGRPLHENGFASVPGVYFVGLPFAISRRSGTILAIAAEAAQVVENIQRRLHTCA